MIHQHMSCILHVGNRMKYDCGRIFIDGLNPDDTSQSLLSARCDSDKYGFVCQQIGMKFIISKSCLVMNYFHFVLTLSCTGNDRLNICLKTITNYQLS